METVLNCLRLIAMTWAIGVHAPVFAAPTPGDLREIDHLLGYLENSGCAFARSGKWYDARAARAHLDMKFKFLLQRDMVKNTDDFIVKAATGSSMGGDVYAVRCGDGVKQPSADWLRAELIRYRNAPSAGTKPATR